MQLITNRFGTENMYTVDDIINENHHACIYVVCTACMSVWTDALSYIESHPNINFTRKFDEYVSDVIVLSCQVTDLAIYNDIKTMEEIHKRDIEIRKEHHNFPPTNIYCGGCLAQRFDIPLPDYVRRLDVFRTENISISEETFKKIDYRKPFWNTNLKDDADEFEEGNLFRRMYPLKTGAGCHGKCTYCTIRDTRGPSYQVNASDQEQEFVDHEDVVLICDSPSPEQINDWIEIAIKHNKPISFRNVEPPVANYCMNNLIRLASKGLLRIFHCPIQSIHEEALRKMNRNVKATFDYIKNAQKLHELGVIVATNIIIDYVEGDNDYNTWSFIRDYFDYVSWNPYFDGNFDIKKAEERFNYYF